MEDIMERAFFEVKVAFIDWAILIVNNLTLGDHAVGLMWPPFAPGLGVKIGERLGCRGCKVVTYQTTKHTEGIDVDVA